MNTHLEYKDEKSHKFWKIELSGTGHTVTYGKTGTNGQSKTKNFETIELAEKDAKKLIASKVKKGYYKIHSDLNENNQISISEFIEKAKSGLKKEIDEPLKKHILSLAKDSVSKSMIEECLEDYEEFVYDTVYYKGDVTFDSSFNLFDNNFANVIIEGSLTINGLLNTYDDPSQLLLVTGDLKTTNLINSGFLVVNGNLEVEESLIGDYNHGQVYVEGNSKARFFHPEKHYFTIKGDITFNCAIGSSFGLNDNENKKVFNLKEKGLEKLLSILNPDLLKLLDEEYKELLDDGDIKYTDEIWEVLERKDFLNHIRSGKSVLK